MTPEPYNHRTGRRSAEQTNEGVHEDLSPLLADSIPFHEMFPDFLKMDRCQSSGVVLEEHEKFRGNTR
jgi:hypothetical protein